MDNIDPYADWHVREESNYTTPPSGLVATTMTPASSPTGFSEHSDTSTYTYPNASNDILFDNSAFDPNSFIGAGNA